MGSSTANGHNDGKAKTPLPAAHPFRIAMNAVSTGDDPPGSVPPTVNYGTGGA